MITDVQRHNFADLFYRFGDHTVKESLYYGDYSNDDTFLKLLYSAMEGALEDYNDRIRLQHDIIVELKIRLEEIKDIVNNQI